MASRKLVKASYGGDNEILFIAPVCKNISCGTLGIVKDEKEIKMYRCGKCLHVFYCSAKCQREDWVLHKPKCKKSTKTYTMEMIMDIARTFSIPPHTEILLVELSCDKNTDRVHTNQWALPELGSKNSPPIYSLINKKIKTIKDKDLTVLAVGQFYFIVEGHTAKDSPIDDVLDLTPYMTKKNHNIWFEEIKGINEIILKFRLCTYRVCTRSSLETGSCLDNKKLFSCSRCKSFYYCSQECQQLDWGHHQGYCHLSSEYMDYKTIEHIILKYPFPSEDYALYSLMDNNPKKDPKFWPWHKFKEIFLNGHHSFDVLRLCTTFINKKIASLKKKGLIVIECQGNWFVVRRITDTETINPNIGNANNDDLD
jgi:hypothetical protein